MDGNFCLESSSYSIYVCIYESWWLEMRSQIWREEMLRCACFQVRKKKDEEVVVVGCFGFAHQENFKIASTPKRISNYGYTFCTLCAILFLRVLFETLRETGKQEMSCQVSVYEIDIVS